MDKASIQLWVAKYIETFRRFRASSEFAGLEVSNLDDMREPTQLLVVSLAALGCQPVSILLGFHIPSALEGTVHAIGPSSPSDVKRQVLALLEGDPWRQHAPVDPLLMPEGESTYAQIAAIEIAQALNTFDQRILDAAYDDPVAPRTALGKRMVPPDGFVWNFLGDFTSRKVEEEVRKTFTAPPTSRTIPSSTANRPARSDRVWFFGAPMYPLTFVGKRPLSSVEDIVERRRLSPWMMSSDALETTFDGHRVIIKEDGFVAVEVQDRGRAQLILNHIMAYLWASGVADVTTLRENELWSLHHDPTNPINRGLSVETVSVRNLSAVGASVTEAGHRLARVIPVVDMRRAIRDAEGVFGAGDASLGLLFLHQAHTSFSESDYRSAFIDAWFVLEQWVYSHWRAELAAKGRKPREIKDLEDQRNWTVATMAETLELTGVIDRQRLDALTRWRRIRNRVAHDGYSPTHDEVHGVLDLAILVFREQIGRQ